MTTETVDHPETGEARVLTIPLPDERIAILEIPAGLSSEDHEFIVKYLKLMKGALVGNESK